MKVYFTLLIFVFIVSCQKDHFLEYMPPKLENDNIQVGTFRSNGMDSVRLFDYLKNLPG